MNCPITLTHNTTIKSIKLYKSIASQEYFAMPENSLLTIIGDSGYGIELDGICAKDNIKILTVQT